MPEPDDAAPEDEADDPPPPNHVEAAENLLSAANEGAGALKGLFSPM